MLYYVSISRVKIEKSSYDLTKEKIEE